MNASDPKLAVAYPNFFRSLLTGFDRISRHAWLALFPIALDLWLWLGLHIPVTTMIRSLNEQLTDVAGLDVAQGGELIEASQEIWQMLAERFNLMIALRAYPVGIPSLMAGRLAVESPVGTPFTWEVYSIPGALLVWVALSILGLILGTLYYHLVAQATLADATNLRAALAAWPRNALRVLGVALALVLLYLLVTLPASCLMVVASLGGLGQCVTFLYVVFLAWLLFPFFLSGHGIFVYGDGTSVSVARGARVARLLAVPTSLLVLTILASTQLLDVLWNVTAESSWLTLLGIVGHAFVTTGLLAGTFIYYQAADLWVSTWTNPVRS
ncbi:MAG: hypothetical protein ACOYYS_04330 [Chloroflexota bacterium]